MSRKLPFVWDYDIDEQTFREILDGKRRLGRLDQDWAAPRLLEYASYPEIVRWLGYPRLVENWSRWRPHIRSESRKRGFDFLVEWLPQAHPELCNPQDDQPDQRVPTVSLHALRGSVNVQEPQDFDAVRRQVVDQRTKDIIKQALVELIEERKDLFYDLFTEIIEETNLANAIQKGLSSDSVESEEIKQILKDEN
jgi:hypothetical protein